MSVMNSIGGLQSMEEAANNDQYLGMFLESGLEGIDGELLDEATKDALFEQFIIEEVSTFTDREREEFLESELCDALVEAGRMRRNTIVFLSGKDDLARRTKMASLTLAKQRNDPLISKIKALRIKERKYISQIMKKYGGKGNRIAKKSQKDWIRNRMPQNFGKFGGQDRVSATAQADNGPRKHHDGLRW